MKFSKKLAMLLTAAALAITPAVETFAEPITAVEINAKKEPVISSSDLELKVGESTKLKMTGTKKKVKWSSSDTSVVKVNKKGKVDAIADGAAVITAKIGKKEYFCTVNVWSQEFAIDTSLFRNNGMVLWYSGKLDLDAIYTIDGVVASSVKFEDGESVIYSGTEFSDGDHVLTVSKAGYKTFNYTFNWTAPVYTGIFANDPWINDGTLYLLLNPAIENANPGYEVDGSSVIPKNSFVNGDGYFVVWIDASSISEGVHKVTVSAEGFGTETRQLGFESAFLLRKPVIDEDGDLGLSFKVSLIGTPMSFEIDGVAVEPAGENTEMKDNYYVWFTVSGIASGEHTIKVSVEGYEPETYSFNL